MDPELQAFLTTHHHVVTTREAAALGFNREVLRRLVQRKVVTRVARGAYVQTSVLLGHRHLADHTSCAPAPCSAGTRTGGRRATRRPRCCGTCRSSTTVLADLGLVVVPQYRIVDDGRVVRAPRRHS